VDEVHWHTLAWRRLVGKTLPVTHGFENRLFSADQSHTPAWRHPVWISRLDVLV
jgi:DMSO/TMAO reductase YedYZ molybdopterin-dependent catalytic subunit